MVWSKLGVILLVKGMQAKHGLSGRGRAGGKMLGQTQGGGGQRTERRDHGSLQV